jgi:hypothetical protein
MGQKSWPYFNGGRMCLNLSKNIGRAFLLASLLFLLSLAVYSQEKNQPQEWKPFDNLTKLLAISPNKAPLMQDPSKPLVLRLADRLELWDNWSIELEKCVEQTQSLSQKHEADWQKKSDTDQQLIASLRLENSLLKDVINNATKDKILIGSGGFLAGLGFGAAVGYAAHK